MDRYRSISELFAQEREGHDFRIRASARTRATLVLAPHGGDIEPGTTELARAVAGGDHAWYSFEGINGSHGPRLHITSTRFDEARCLAMVSASHRVLALHGERGEDEVVYTGGRDRALRESIEQHLDDHGFAVSRHHRLRGMSPRNICNRGSTGAGVQLELSKGLRRTLFRSLYPHGRAHTTARFDKLVTALRAALA